VFFVQHLHSHFPVDGNCKEDSPFTCLDVTIPVPFASVQTLPIFTSSFFFAFEGIALVCSLSALFGFLS
jgi:hypothetical protein